MPILSQEVDVFPDDILGSDSIELDFDTQWWAVYTRSRQEKELARRLLALEIPFYCPTVPNRHRSPSGRVRTSFVPLFTNYLFMKCDGSDRYRALQTNLISQTLEVEDPVEFTQDLRQIQLLLQRGMPIRLESRPQLGTRVRIKDGPLRGIMGVVTKIYGESHLFVAVNFLQQGASLKLMDCEVEPT